MKFYTGSYTKLGGAGITFGEINGNSFTLTGTYFLPNPIYLILNRNKDRLYSVSYSNDETENFADCFAVEKNGLQLLSRQKTIGVVPCHLCLSHDEKFLYTANYRSGCISVFPVTENGIEPLIQHICHKGKSIEPERQAGPHVHHVSFLPGKSILCAVDLGLDALVMYNQNPKTGCLTFFDRLDTPAGLGPRHLVYGSNDMVYLNFELGNKAAVLKYRDGKWETLQMLPTLPEGYSGKSTTAAIRLSPDGKLLLVSNRGHDSIAVYDVSDDGLLSLRGIYPSGGCVPRDFIFADKNTLLISHQEGALHLSSFDPAAGIVKIGELPLKGTVNICL